MDYNEINFGSSIAEDEDNQLPDYFLATRYWQNLFKGKTDVILGPKGSGKSALYLNLLSQVEQFKEKKIYLFKAEDPRGDTIFSLFNKMTTNSKYESPQKEYLIEQDIVDFWKLYFLTIIITELKKANFKSEEISKLILIFEECGLIPEELNLRNIFRHVVHYLKQVVTLQFFQPEIEIDPTTGMIKAFKGKISFKELTPQKIKEGFLTLDDLFSHIDKALNKQGGQVWIAIDRLDVAFQEDLTLEKRALKSLFTVYNSLKSSPNIKLKIFLRDDIWEKITIDGGLREASHIVKRENIKWDKDNIFHLVLKRIVSNNEICIKYNCKPETVLESIDLQRELFYKIFPDLMTVPDGSEKLTFDWFLEMLADGNEIVTPREVIHLLNEINTEQGELIGFGNKIANDKLYTKEALQIGMQEVSVMKFEQTLLAENPLLAEAIKEFKYSSEPIIKIEWIKGATGFEDDKKVIQYCAPLEKIGFLKRIGIDQYSIPYLYQYPLKNSVK